MLAVSASTAVWIVEHKYDVLPADRSQPDVVGEWVFDEAGIAELLWEKSCSVGAQNRVGNFAEQGTHGEVVGEDIAAVEGTAAADTIEVAAVAHQG